MRKLCLLVVLSLLAGCANGARPPRQLPLPPAPTPAPTPAPNPLKNNVVYVKSDAEIEALRKNSKGQPYIGYFYADWCGPCKQIKEAGIVEGLAKQNPDIIFLKINVDSCPNTSKYYKIRSIPTMVVAQQYFVGGGQITVANIQKVINERRLEVLKSKGSRVAPK